MSDAWERLCKAVGATPETVFPGYTLVGKQPNPPAYLRKPNRKRWRGIIRAALGRAWSRSWRYRMTKSLGRHWPHMGYIKHLRRQHEIIQRGDLRDMLIATPATGGQSAASCGAKEGRSPGCHGDG